MKLSAVHQIEVTSKCNLSCIYCIHRIMKRPKEDMNIVTFGKALDLCKLLWRKQTQKELWLHGLGESLMHPEFTKYCEAARKALPGLPIRASTNAELLTQEHVDCMADLGIRLHISMHRPEKLQHTPRMAHEAGILEYMDCSAVTHGNDWAGQVDWGHNGGNFPCGWLEGGWTVVLANGDITTCCVDAEGLGIVGNIRQPLEELVQLEIKPYKLCNTCNLTIPEGV